jgi:amino acid transporter
MSTSKPPISSAVVYARKSSGLIRSITARDALMSNLVAMGLVVNIWWIVWASLLYPNADLPSTVFIALVANLIIAFVYWMLSTAMPRTGGDYVFVGRILHPSLGFMVNFMLVTAMITWVGIFAQLNAVYFMPTMFINLAHGTGNTSYLGLGTWMTTPNGQFITALAMVTIVLLVMLLPVKWIFRILVTVFALQAIIYIWFIATLLPISHADFVQAFNAKSGTTVEAILDVAKNKAGVDWTITIYGTFIGIVYTMLSYIGYANSAYFAGELGGDPKKSQGLAIFVSPFIFSAAIWALYALSYQVFGHDFLVASSTLALSSDPSISSAWYNYAATIPTPAYLVSFISDNPLFIVAVPFGLVLTAFGFAATYFFVPVRNIFAWAFDRTIPLKFAEVDRRGVPWVSTLLYGAIAYVSVYLAVYTTVFSYFTYTNFGWFLGIAIVMFAAAGFPWLAKEIYNTAPSIVKMKIGSLPVITLLGVMGGFLSLFVSYASIIPAYTGMEINPVYIVSLLIVFVVALVIYGVSYAYHKAKGVPIDLVAKELPPL